ncbi:MAG: hypothetical protein ACKN9M_00900 [Burkholderiaceae bacterium]|jgi:hypothetical protein
MKLRLAQIAHARSGDKGDIADIGLFAWEPTGYAMLAKQVTADVVQQHLKHLWSEKINLNESGQKNKQIDRFDLPNLLALKFVLRGTLNGGAASSLRSDNLGKTIAAQLLRLEIDVPDHEATAVLKATEQALVNF